jgi:hypothetical protein
MNWKVYYREELECPESRDRIAGWLDGPRGRAIEAGITRGAIVSFPHTALRFAGPLQARVVSALYRSGTERILALGVLHAGGVEPLRCARDESCAPEERLTAFETVGGVFATACAEFSTPFGSHPLWAPAKTSGVLRVDQSGWLANEFSLDTFVAIVRLAADAFERPPIPVFPAYVGLTRHPITGDFCLSRRVADWLREHVGPATAVVTTGDLVHHGTPYGAPAGGLPATDDRGVLERSYLEEVTGALDAAFLDGDPSGAYRRSLQILRSDQRELLPVVAFYLEEVPRYDIVHFELSDYAKILAVSPPCFVASALVIYG